MTGLRVVVVVGVATGLSRALVRLIRVTGATVVAVSVRGTWPDLRAVPVWPAPDLGEMSLIRIADGVLECYGRLDQVINLAADRRTVEGVFRPIFTQRGRGRIRHLPRRARTIDPIAAPVVTERLP